MSNYVISISREFGSGGRLIGKQLAARLGIPCYDRTLILKTAEKSGLSRTLSPGQRSGPAAAFTCPSPQSASGPPPCPATASPSATRPSSPSPT
ncbi:MAG: cytidylate kinase family protein [Lawsonibacter sp.]